MLLQMPCSAMADHPLLGEDSAIMAMVSNGGVMSVGHDEVAGNSLRDYCY